MSEQLIWLRDGKSKLKSSVTFDDGSGKILIDYTNANNGSASLEIIKFVDVVGCHRMKGKSPSDCSSYITLFSYPYRPQQNLKKPKRRCRKVYTFQIFTRPTYDENVNVANVWVEKINGRCRALYSPHRIGLASSFRRKLVVFVNPYSGPGRALQIFQEKVMPIFAEADIVCRLVITERANHARDLVYKMDLMQWDGIVIVSGDGLVFEVLNGLTARPDRDRALNIPIGVVPGGSGNALAAACCFEATDSCKFDYAVDSAVTIAKPNYANMKLVHVQTMTENIISFMSIGWGLLSDIDIESEKFRRLLGPARFTAGAVVRWASLRTYKGRLSFKLVDEDKSNLRQVLKQQSSPLIINQPKKSSFDGALINRPTSLRDLRATQSCFEIQELTVDYNPEVSFEEDDFSAPGSIVRDVSVEPGYEEPVLIKTPNGDVPLMVPPLGQQVNYDTVIEMPNINEPVPRDWMVIEDNFILLYAVYLTHIGSDLPYMPCSHFDDGCMYLTVVRANSTSRVNLAKFLLTIESGHHLELPCVEVYPVSAFRLERMTEGGMLTVDGEHIKCTGPVQACVTNHKATVMTVHSNQNRLVSRL